MSNVHYLTIYGGDDIYAIKVGPEDDGWEEASETPPQRTLEERLSYITYLSHQVDYMLPVELHAKKYLRRLQDVADIEKPFEIPVVDHQEKIDARSAENEAYMEKQRALARQLGMPEPKF